MKITNCPWPKTKTEESMKPNLATFARRPFRVRCFRWPTTALLAGLTLMAGTTCLLHAQLTNIQRSVLLSWPEPTEEQIVVGADSLTGLVWTPWPEPIFKRFGQLCMTVPTTANSWFAKLVPGRQFADDFSDSWGPFTYRRPWTSAFQSDGEEWTVTNGVLQVDWNAPTYPGFCLAPLGTNVADHLRDVYTSVDLLDCVAGSTNASVLTLAGRGRITGPNSGVGYFGGLTLNHTGVLGEVQPWIYSSDYTYGPTFDLEEFPLPYRLEFSVVGSRISFQVLSLTTGQLIRQLSVTNSVLPTGFVGLWINGRNNPGLTFRMTADNFFMSGTKP
jgi:hypothetical protein